MEKNKDSLSVFSEERNYNLLQAITKIQAPTSGEVVGKTPEGFYFIDGDTCVHMLNYAFNYQWSFEVIDSHSEVSQVNPKNQNDQRAIVHVLGRMTVPGMGVREQWGSKDLSGGPKVQQSAYKSATTDAMKKCASLFGVALDVTSKYNQYWPNYDVKGRDFQYVNAPSVKEEFDTLYGGRKIAEAQKASQVAIQETTVHHETVVPPVGDTISETVVPATNTQPQNTFVPEDSSGVHYDNSQPSAEAPVKNEPKKPVMTSLAQSEADQLRKAMIQAGFKTVDMLVQSGIIQGVTGNPNAQFVDITNENVADIIIKILETLN